MIDNDIYVRKDFIAVFIGCGVLVVRGSLCRIEFNVASIVYNVVFGFNGLTFVVVSRCLILVFIVFIIFICFLTLIRSFALNLVILFYIIKSIYTLF